METDTAQELFRGYLYRRYGDRSTPKHYLSDLTIFLAYLGEKSVTSVTAKDIDGFVDQQHAQILAPATINRRLATLRTFFEYLASEEPDKSRPNPVNWRRHGVRVGKALPRDAIDPEVERLFAVIEDVRDAAMFGLMVGAGLRVSEVVDLRIADLERVNLAEQLVLLRVQGKGHKERIVWLTATWHGKVIAWLAVRPETADDHLFLNQHKRKLTKDGVQFRLKQYCDQAGLSLTCHQLRQCEASRRDTFATRLLNQGVSLEVVRKLLGHSSLQMSQHYARLYDSTVKEQFESATGELEGVVVRDWPIPAATPVPVQAVFQQVDSV